MNLPIIVCPFDPRLIQRISGHTLAVRVNGLSDATEAARQVRESRNRLAFVIVETDGSLADFTFPEETEDIPLAIMPASFGKFSNLARQIKRLRNFNLRVYLSCDKAENIAGLRILSSLGIHCCAMFGKGTSDWGGIADLMTYALLERSPHGSIEPFSFIAANYDPSSQLDWGRFYFDDPIRFLHINGSGSVALSHAELQNKRFVADDLSKLTEPAACSAIGDRQNSWRNFFACNHPCASCESWKICVGRFSGGIPEDGECSGFFREMLGVIRQHKPRNTQSRESTIWQP